MLSKREEFSTINYLDNRFLPSHKNSIIDFLWSHKNSVIEYFCGHIKIPMETLLCPRKYNLQKYFCGYIKILGRNFVTITHT